MHAEERCKYHLADIGIHISVLTEDTAHRQVQLTLVDSITRSIIGLV